MLLIINDMNESFLCLGNFGMVTGPATARAQGTEEGSSAVEVVPTMLDAWRVPERGGTGWQVFQSGIHEERESIGRAAGGVDINMGYLRTGRREGGPRSL